MEYEIKHQPERKLFKAEIEGRTAFVQYRLLNGCLDIIHTIVPRPLEGQGIAAALVEATYSYAIANGHRPKATCTYAIRWLQKHPDVENKAAEK